MNRPRANQVDDDDDDCLIIDCIDRRSSPSVFVVGSYKENQCPQSPRCTTPVKRARRNIAETFKVRESPAHVSSVVQQKPNGKVFIRSTSGILTPTNQQQQQQKQQPDVIVCDSSEDEDLEIIEVFNPFVKEAPKPPSSAAIVVDKPPPPPPKTTTPTRPFSLNLKFVNTTPPFSRRTTNNEDAIVGKVNSALDHVLTEEKRAVLSAVKQTTKPEPIKDEELAALCSDHRLHDLTDELVGMDLSSPKPEAKAKLEPGSAKIERSLTKSIQHDFKTSDTDARNAPSPLRLPVLRAEKTDEQAEVTSKPTESVVKPPPEPKLHLFEYIIQNFNRSVKTPLQPQVKKTGTRVVDLNDHYLTSTYMAHFNSTNELHHIMETLELVGSIVNMNQRLDICSSLDLADRCINYYLKLSQSSTKYSHRQWVLFFQRLSQICEFAEISELLEEIKTSASHQELAGLSKDLELYWLKFLELFKRLFERLANTAEDLASENHLHVLSRSLVELAVGLFARYSQVVFAFKRAFTAKNTNWLLNTDKSNPFYLDAAYFKAMMGMFSEFVINLLNASKSNSLGYSQIIKSTQEFLVIAFHCGSLSSQKTRVREMINFLVKIYGKLERIETKQVYLSHLIAYQEMKKRVCVELLIGNQIPLSHVKVKACKQDAGKTTSDWEHSIILEKLKAILEKKNMNAPQERNAFGEYANAVSIYLGEPIKHETQMFSECFDTGFQDYTDSLACLKDRIAEHLRTKAIDVANFLGLAHEFMFLAESVAKVS